MRRAATMLIAFAITIAVAGCGDDDSEQPSPVEAGVTTTVATPSTSQAAAPTTTTTSAAAITGPGAFIAAAVEYVGTYEGTWNNTTFDTSGPVSINILEVNTNAGFVLVEIDLGGNVFGGEDPEPFVMEIFIDGDGLTVGFGTFFRSTLFEIDETGHFTLTAGIADLLAPLVVNGDVVNGGFEGTYSVEDLAEGTWTATPTG